MYLFAPDKPLDHSIDVEYVVQAKSNVILLILFEVLFLTFTYNNEQISS